MDEILLYPFARLTSYMEERVFLSFPEGLLGFSKAKDFFLRVEERSKPYFFLEERHGDHRFIVCDPFHFFADYSPAIARGDMEALSVREGSTLLLLTLVNARCAPPRLHTRAPLLIHWEAKLGRQIIVNI